MSMAVAEQPTGALIIKDSSSDASKLEEVLIGGDLAGLTSAQRVVYYQKVCEVLELNPLTKPFDYLNLNGKLVLYANKSCTEQLREKRRIEVTKLERERADDLAIVVAYGRDRTGRGDSSMGAVSVKGLQGEALANALMKAETKAKRRLTLALSGLGILDEVEIDSTPGAWRQAVDMETGELLESGSVAGAPEPTSLTERMAARAASVTTQAAEPSDAAPAEAAVPASPASAPDEPRADDPVASGEVEPKGPPEVPSPASITALTDKGLRDWLRERFIGLTEAQKHIRTTWGDDATIASITDEQRAETAAAVAHLAKG